MNKVFLSSRFSRKDEMCEVRKRLQELGFVITSRWLDTDYVDRPTESSVAPPEYREKYCMIDLEDVIAADIVISFTEQPKSEHSRGGRHVEFGYALALGKMMIVVGPRENIFHHHGGISVIEETEPMLETMEKYMRYIENISDINEVLFPSELVELAREEERSPIFHKLFDKRVQ